MRRLLVASMLMVGARTAAAQSGIRLPVQFVSSGDSAFAVPSGGNLALVVASQYDGTGWGLDSFAVRIHFDPARFSYVSATKLCSNQGAALNVTPAASYVDISTASCTSNYFGESLFQITFKLGGAATDGAWFSLEPLALRDNGANDRLADGVVDVAQACHAFGIWGDLDGDGAVNSRDALATLSAAVGLPVPRSSTSRGAAVGAPAVRLRRATRSRCFRRRSGCRPAVSAWAAASSMPARRSSSCRGRFISRAARATRRARPVSSASRSAPRSTPPSRSLVTARMRRCNTNGARACRPTAAASCSFARIPSTTRRGFAKPTRTAPIPCTSPLNSRRIARPTGRPTARKSSSPSPAGYGRLTPT